MTGVDVQDTRLFLLEPSSKGDWRVMCESTPFGRFDSFSDALRKAVEEATEAGDLGYASAVVARDDDDELQILWLYGVDDDLPPSNAWC